MPPVLAAGRVVSERYRVLGVLGRGGMGVVYKVEDLALKRQVALKLISVQAAVPGEHGDPSEEERVLHEASLTAQIAHPNVVTIYDYGRAEERDESFCYIAMELLSGESLGERLRRIRTGLPRTETVALMIQVARGLRAAHQRGLMHRDLKPDNIMLTPGEDAEEVVRILDFGLAKEVGPGAHRGSPEGDAIVGTPEYMAPEQVEAKHVDCRADLYALGVVLYECITGSPPFQGENAFRVARAHLRDPVPPMRIASGVPRPSLPLQELVKKLLEKRPAARIQTADEVLRRLRELPEARALRPAEAAQNPSFSTRNRYQTGRKISETPRAIVYDATHMQIGRPTVLKVFRTTSSTESTRVLRELPPLALLRHPSNVRVLDMGSTVAGPYGLPFVVMERVRGPTLRALVSNEGKLPLGRAVRIIAAVLDGLAEAHGAGLAHRHLTPEHVLVPEQEVTNERAKIIGYRLADRDAERSDARALVLPEPVYVAPEVARNGAPMNERADLYSVAVMLYECLLGRRPPAALLAMGRSDPPPNRTDIPAALADVLRRGISIDPGDRFESASTFAAELRAACDEEDGLRSPADPDDAGARSSASQRRLRSTGLPTLWFLTGDPALSRPHVVDSLLQLRASMRVEGIPEHYRAALAARIRSGEEQPPWVVLFGGVHVLREDPLLEVLASTPEVARLLVSTHVDVELLEAAIRFGGLDHHVSLFSEPEGLVPAVGRMVTRAGAARRYYDDLRMVARRGGSTSNVLARQG